MKYIPLKSYITQFDWFMFDCFCECLVKSTKTRFSNTIRLHRIALKKVNLQKNLNQIVD